jgi:nicotinamidase/pyrazinamidase
MAIPTLHPEPGDALLVVDVQNDFVTGSLAVPGGREIVEPLNAAIAAFVAAGRPVFLSRDWHPADHRSFREHGGPWPPHCVAGAPGAEFVPGLAVPPDAVFVLKATRRDADAYSAFDGTALDRELRARGVRRVIVGGIATDYCVLATALDARRLGYDVVVLADAVRAVDAKPGDGLRALSRMRAAGARLLPDPPPG